VIGIATMVEKTVQLNLMDEKHAHKRKMDDGTARKKSLVTRKGFGR
jgi:hypothetical protein